MAQEYGRGLMGLSEATSQYTFPGVLHHLQSEWRQYERERNEWEIERAEMRARIALLEGERASMENAKTDLMRRVKMLEFALRQERARYLAATAQVSEASGRASPASPSEGASQDKPAPDHDDKHERERARERDDDHDPPAHDAHAHDRDHDDARPNRLPSMPSRPLSSRGSRPDSALGAPMAGLLVQKDPKSRVRSREFMQQCLQEINYLTSASALNPLPDHGTESIVGATSAAQLANAPRPRRTMDDPDPPLPERDEHDE